MNGPDIHAEYDRMCIEVSRRLTHNPRKLENFIIFSRGMWEVETQVYSSPQGDDSGEETDEASSGEESAEEGSSGEQNEDL